MSHDAPAEIKGLPENARTPLKPGETYKNTIMFKFSVAP